MNIAEIIKTYAAYLPDGTKRDRYRKEYIQQLTTNNNTNINSEKRKEQKETRRRKQQNTQTKYKK